MPPFIVCIMKKFIEFLTKHKEALVLSLCTLMCFVGIILICSSCKHTTATVYNGADNTQTEIRITTSNPTTVSVPSDTDVVFGN